MKLPIKALKRLEQVKLSTIIADTIARGYATVNAATYIRTHAHRREREALASAIYLDQLVNHHRRDTHPTMDRIVTRGPR